jgi:hypothetical protein
VQISLLGIQTKCNAEPNLFYHVSCVEQILDLRTLLESKQLQHDGGFKFVRTISGIAPSYESVHIAIDDWFENAGTSFDLQEYNEHEKAYNEWGILALIRMTDHLRHVEDGDNNCSCDPEPERPIYSTKERIPRLLSEVLASITKVEQIDNIPKWWLDYLFLPEYDTEGEEEEGPEGANKGKEPLDAEEDSSHVSRKATDLEMKERRKKVVDHIKKLKREIAERSKLKDKDHEEAREREVGPRVQDGVEKDYTEKTAENTSESRVSEKASSVQVAEKDTNDELVGGK